MVDIIKPPIIVAPYLPQYPLLVFKEKYREKMTESERPNDNGLKQVRGERGSNDN